MQGNHTSVRSGLTNSGNLTTADRSNAIAPLSSLLVDRPQEEGEFLLAGLSVLEGVVAWVESARGAMAEQVALAWAWSAWASDASVGLAELLLAGVLDV